MFEIVESNDHEIHAKEDFFMFLHLKRRLGKCTALLLCLFLCMAAGPSELSAADAATDAIPGWPKGPSLIYSDTAVLMEASTGAVLYDKGMDEVRYPASITKIMTAVIALENSNLTDTVTFTDTACALAVPGNANIGAKPGEVLTMEQCLYALMLKSANEVACQIAIQVAGSEAAFADMMNAKAAELGCTNTHFTNASGLHDANHYTTAHDMALIMQYAIKNQEFLTITGTLNYTIPATNLSGERTLSTHNAMMVPGDFYYEGTFSGKSGNTEEAGSTLVTCVSRNSMVLICVVMKAADGGQATTDTISLMDYGYNNFSLSDASALREGTSGTIVLPNGIDPSALTVQENSPDGQNTTYVYSYQNQYLGSAVKTADTEEGSGNQTDSQSPEPSAAPGAETTSSGSAPGGFSDSSRILIALLTFLIIAGIFGIFLGLKKPGKKKHKRR